MKQSEFILENFEYIDEQDDRYNGECYYEFIGYLPIIYYDDINLFYYDTDKKISTLEFKEVYDLIQVDKILERLMVE